MLSVLIETRNDEDALARTLSSLVSAAVEGVVREVVVCDRGSSDQTLRVADHAGCICLNEDIAAGIRRAKGDWLLFLEPGARLDAHWTEAVINHLSHHAASPARFSRSRASSERFLSRIFSARRPLADGLVISKGQARALARAGSDAQAIARGVSARRLPAEISAAPRRK